MYATPPASSAAPQKTEIITHANAPLAHLGLVEWAENAEGDDMSKKIKNTVLIFCIPVALKIDPSFEQNLLVEQTTINKTSA